MGKIKLIIGASILFLVSAQVNASIVTFNDKSTFIGATGSTSATGAIPDLGFVGSSATVGDVTFSRAPPGGGIWVGASGNVEVPGGDWAPVIPGNDVAIDGIENINVELASSVFSFGFDFQEPSIGRDIPNGIIIGSCFVPVCTDSTFEVTLLDNSTFVGSFMFNAPDDVLSFIGVSSDLAFNRVEIRDLTATIDDEYFGEFYTAAFPIPVVTIDIKPGSDPNSINPRSNGVIPVAVLGSIDFDATQVDFSTVTFGPDGASPAHDGHVEDVNDDGFMDMVFHFKTRETGIACGDPDATLTGKTTGGTQFTGTDTVKTVGCKGSNQDTSVKGAGTMSWLFLVGLSVLGLWRRNRLRDRC